jgi:hypothetical protein
LDGPALIAGPDLAPRSFYSIVSCCFEKFNERHEMISTFTGDGNNILGLIKIQFYFFFQENAFWGAPFGPENHLFLLIIIPFGWPHQKQISENCKGCRV